MRNWRIISTIAAVVLAAIAGVLVWKYVTDADTRAEKDKHLVTALVAKERIARGTVFNQILTDGNFKTVKVPEDSLPPNRILPGTNDICECSARVMIDRMPQPPRPRFGPDITPHFIQLDGALWPAAADA